MTPLPGTPLPWRKTVRQAQRGVPTGRRKPYQKEDTAMSEPTTGSTP